MALKSELEENPYEPPIEEDPIKSSSEYRTIFETEEDFQEAAAIWPKCPQCGRRRTTRCPVCKTSRDIFPLGDSAFWSDNSDETSARDAQTKCERAPNESNVEGNTCENSGCSCGSNGCACDSFDNNRESAKTPVCPRGNRHDDALYAESERAATLDGEMIPGVPSPRRICSCQEKTSDVFDNLPEQRQRLDAWPEGNADQGQSAPVCVCNVCSEAFVPQFPRRCEWCGYDFGNGLEEDVELESEDANGVSDFLARKREVADEAEDVDVSKMAIVIASLVVVGAILFWLFSRAI